MDPRPQPPGSAVRGRRRRRSQRNDCRPPGRRKAIRRGTGSGLQGLSHHSSPSPCGARRSLEPRAVCLGFDRVPPHMLWSDGRGALAPRIRLLGVDFRETRQVVARGRPDARNISGISRSGSVRCHEIWCEDDVSAPDLVSGPLDGITTPPQSAFSVQDTPPVVVPLGQRRPGRSAGLPAQS